MSDKTHWKKVVSDPNYIGEGDFQKNQEMVVTIKSISQTETVVTAEGKTEKAVVHFEEAGVKPMILNVARSKSIEKVVGSPYFEDWSGTKIQLFVESGIKAFGDIVNAVRVRPFKPKLAEPIPPCSDCGKPIISAIGKSPEWMASYTKKNYGVPLCAECAQKRKEAQQEQEQAQTEEAQQVQTEETEDSEDVGIEQQ
ncbi:MAG: hypothetical protein RSA62_07590 [Oscillospiraceae bacterium]